MQNSLSNKAFRAINYIHAIMYADRMLIISPNEPMVELEKKYYGPGTEKITMTTSENGKMIMYEAILRIDNNVVVHGVAYSYSTEEPNHDFTVYVDNTTEEYYEGSGSFKDKDSIGLKERFSTFIDHLIKLLDAPNTTIHITDETYCQAYNDYLDNYLGKMS